MTERHRCFTPNKTYFVRWVEVDGELKMQVAEDNAVTGVWTKWRDAHSADECTETENDG